MFAVPRLGAGSTSCSALRAGHARRVPRSARRGARATSTSCASTARRSPPARPTRSTTRSWRRPRHAVVVPVDAAGPTSAPGARCGSIGEKDADGNVVHGDVHVDATPAAATCAPRSRLVAASASRTSWWSRPPTRCWSRTRERAQDVKDAGRATRRRRPRRARSRTAVLPPWGSYDSVENGERFQVKRIMVKPGRGALAADAPPPRRALDRRPRHGARHARRGEVPR